MEQQHQSPVDFNQFLNFELTSASNPFDLDQLELDHDLYDLAQGQDQLNTYLPTASSAPEFLSNGLAASSAVAVPEDAAEASFPGIDDLPINVPSFWRPSVPCDYCLSRQLDCVFTVENQDCCSACTSLFRPCSFTNPQARAAHGYLDTLSSVAEDSEQLRGEYTSTKPLFSLGASMNDILDNIMKTKPERSTTRFPRSTTLILKKWLDAHSDNPYPTEEEKDELKDQTGLSRSQISNWLANARRRGKVKPKRCVSPSLQHDSSSDPINIPRRSPSHDGKDQAHLTPFERWKASPPENEPAPISAITKAAESTKYNPGPSGSSSQTQSLVDQHRSSSGAGSMFRTQSISSMETGQSSGSLASTNGSAYSYGSRSSYNSFAGKDRRRRRRTMPKNTRRGSATGAPKIFQCTFCTDTFHIKYDWSRHEKSLHLSLEKWICAPLGPKVTSASDGSTRCVYCQLLNPPPDHFDVHNHSECEEKGRAARTFFRKDHLRQHLRLIHNVGLSPEMEAWKSAPEIIRSRCGFCPDDKPTTFTTWQDRADHLADHFRKGAHMSQWKGDWGFDPEIAAQVTNAMPPWLIGQESNTPDPFTATANNSRAIARPEEPLNREQIPACEFALGRAQAGKVSTCWEVLTVMLGRFVRQQHERGIEITDGMLQREARLILYGDDDEWNQTAADNAEWLRLFKQAHGLGRDAPDPEATRRPSAIACVVGNDPIEAFSSPASPSFNIHSGVIDPLLPTGNIADAEFQRIFEDAGLFSMDDLAQMPLTPDIPVSLSASAPAAGSSYLTHGSWTMHPDDADSMDTDHDHLGYGYGG